MITRLFIENSTITSIFARQFEKTLLSYVEADYIFSYLRFFKLDYLFMRVFEGANCNNI
jgi:hypothetical protein